MQVCLETPTEFLAVGVLGVGPESLRLASNRNFGKGPRRWLHQSANCVRLDLSSLEFHDTN